MSDRPANICYILCIVFALLVISYTPISSQPTASSNGTTEQRQEALTLSINTDETKYVTGQMITIFLTVGKVNSLTENSAIDNPKVTIKVSREDDSSPPVYQTSFLVLDGNYTHQGLALEEPGTY